MKVFHWIERRLVTSDAIYGLILFSALIAVASDDHGNSVEVFLVSGASLVVFWAAHVYAGTIANHGAKAEDHDRLGVSFRAAIGHASGMLYAAIIPSIVLLLGALPVLSYNDSVDDSLIVVLVMLAAIGYDTFARRQARIVVRIFGALGAALFGFFMIILNTIVH